jgi:hypothetical protein
MIEALLVWWSASRLHEEAHQARAAAAATVAYAAEHRGSMEEAAPPLVLIDEGQALDIETWPPSAEALRQSSSDSQKSH